MTRRYELKPISQQAIPGALAKAERYRLLNEPGESESICRDVLRTDPRNQEALVMLILALTDQFGRKPGVNVGHARDLLPQLSQEYDRHYYAGVISERWAKAQLRASAPGVLAYHWLREAMESFEKAMDLQHARHEEAVLRWNACARLLNQEEIAASGVGGAPGLPDDDVPPH